MGDYNKDSYNTPQGGTAYGGYFYTITSLRENGKFSKTRILIHDLELESLEKYKAEGKNITLKEITYLDIVLAYEGQEIEDASFDFEGWLWIIDNDGNLYKTNFNALEYGLNKNPNNTITKLTEDTNLFEKIALGVGYGFENIIDMVDGNNEKGEGTIAGGKSGIEGIQGQIYDYLLAKGVPPVGVAAIMGNIQGESGFRPDAVNSIGCSGLCQWRKGRLENLKKLAASRGKDWTDVECQLDYLWQELNTDYTKVRDAIMAADQENELEYATWYWGRYFEVFFSNSDSFEASKSKIATRYQYAQHWYQEWQQHHTSEIGGTGVLGLGDSYSEKEERTNNISAEDAYLVEDTLKYACSWVGKVPYKSHANGYGDNTERWSPLKEGRGSDCSWFVYWVFKETGLIKKDQGFIRSKDWGKGGADGGCPGTIKIGTDLSQASPGDVLWWHFGDDWRNHVAIYLGNNKMVECGYTDDGNDENDCVKISTVKQGDGFKQILRFEQLPDDPNGYFDPETNTLHSSVSKSSGNNVKVPFLQGKEEEKTENNKSLTFEKFQEEELWTDKTIAIFDSEGTREEWRKAINARGIKGEPGGTTLYAVNGSTPKYFYDKFKDDKYKDFLKGKKNILVEVGPNDLGDWNSMENLLNLLIDRRASGAKIYLEQIESTSGGSQSAIDAFNQHLKEYESTHDDCYYIETRATPNNLKDENGKVKPELCDGPGLHFLEGKGTYEKWAENTAYAIYEIYQREKELEFMGITIEPENPLYDIAKSVEDVANEIEDSIDDWIK